MKLRRQGGLVRYTGRFRYSGRRYIRRVLYLITALSFGRKHIGNLTRGVWHCPDMGLCTKYVCNILDTIDLFCVDRLLPIELELFQPLS